MKTRKGKIVRQRRRVLRLRKALIRARRVLKRLRRRSPRERALRWAAQQVGTVESPPGSNRGGRITRWQKALGPWLVGQPWCGVFLGAMLSHVGVPISARIASVAAIEDDAVAGRNGLAGIREGRGRPGDLVILFGRGKHVEVIVKATKAGYQTIGGNTSAGDAGSQANGGGVYKRVRPLKDVYRVVVPAYPK